MLQHTCKRAAVGTPERMRHFRLTLFRRCCAAEQIAAEDGGKSQRHYGGSGERYQESDSQRNQHTSFHAREKEKREERGGDDERRVENRHTHLGGGVVDDLAHRLAFSGRQYGVAPQPLVDILDVDNRIVDKTAYGNGYTAETHGVDADV